MRKETIDKLHEVITKATLPGKGVYYVAMYIDPAGGESVYENFEFLEDYDERLEDLIYNLENYGWAIYYKTKKGMRIVWQNDIN